MMHWIFIENCLNSWNRLTMVLGFSRYEIEQWAGWLPLRHYSTYTASSSSYYSLSFIYIIHFDKRLLFKQVVGVLEQNIDLRSGMSLLEDQMVLYFRYFNTCFKPNCLKLKNNLYLTFKNLPFYLSQELTPVGPW